MAMVKQFDYDEHREMFLARCIRAMAHEEHAVFDKTAAEADPAITPELLEHIRVVYLRVVRRLQDFIKPTEKQATAFLLRELGYDVPPDDHDYWKALGL